MCVVVEANGKSDDMVMFNVGINVSWLVVEELRIDGELVVVWVLLVRAWCLCLHCPAGRGLAPFLALFLLLQPLLK